jgi:bifunctional polynucleotide phosphatase/kinase
VGSPGCGKSTFWQNYFSNYVRVNNDTLHTPAKCMAVCRQALIEGKSAVIDNTNPNPDVRKRYLDIAKELKVPARCFYFNVEKSVC